MPQDFDYAMCVGNDGPPPISTVLRETVGPQIAAKYPKMAGQYGFDEVSLSPNGKYVVAWAAKLPASVFTTADRSIVFKTNSQPERVFFSPDGNQFCLVGNVYDKKTKGFVGELIQLWSMPERRRLWEKSLQETAQMTQPGFTDKGRQIFVFGTISNDKTSGPGFHFFETQTGVEKSVVPQPKSDDSLESFKLVEGDERLLVTKRGHTVIVYAVDRATTEKTYNLLENDLKTLEQDQSTLEKSPSLEQRIEILSRRCHLPSVTPGNL